MKRIFAQKKRASLNNSDRQELVGKVYCVLPNKQAGVAAFKHAKNPRQAIIVRPLESGTLPFHLSCI